MSNVIEIPRNLEPSGAEYEDFIPPHRVFETVGSVAISQEFAQNPELIAQQKEQFQATAAGVGEIAASEALLH